jgi:hypothetical protein
MSGAVDRWRPSHHAQADRNGRRAQRWSALIERFKQLWDADIIESKSVESMRICSGACTTWTAGCEPVRSGMTRPSTLFNWRVVEVDAADADKNKRG